MLRMPIAVSSSIATMAVFDTNADSRHVIAPNARITPVVERPARGSARIRNAKRRATPCFEHRLGEDENVDEHEDRRRSERPEHVVDRRDTQEDGDCHPEQTADWDRNRLGDPQRDHPEQHRGELLLLSRDVHV
jgi:hypothetical protein